MTNRKARVSSAGSAIFLSDDDLRKLGVDPDNDDAVKLTIQHNGVQLKPVGDA